MPAPTNPRDHLDPLKVVAACTFSLGIAGQILTFRTKA
jgi:hypothetical protein